MSVQGDEFLAEGVEDGLVAGVQPELVENVANVVLDGVFRDEQRITDLTAGVAISDETENLDLPPGQRWFCLLYTSDAADDRYKV
mgnify:CR=1 FL=1